MKTLMISFAAGLIVLLAACNKKENPAGGHLSTVSGSHLTLKSLTGNAAANGQNPYDYIGYYHNIGLDSLRHFVKANKDTTRRGKYAYLSRYFKANFGADVMPVYDPRERLICTDYKAVLLTQKVSPAAQALLQALSDALQSIRDLDHYDAYKGQVMAIEKNILETELPDDEKKNLLMTAAILRYSGYYWMVAFNKGEITEHAGGSGMATADGLLRKIAGVIAGIAADGSVLALSSFCGDVDIIGTAITMSECCGYYTGWW